LLGIRSITFKVSYFIAGNDGAPKSGTEEIAMTVTRFIKVAALLAVLGSAGAMPTFADGNCGVGVGAGNAKCNTSVGSVAPLPALGTGLPGLLVLVAGLAVFARRRRR
jgi:hypothetical protein